MITWNYFFQGMPSLCEVTTMSSLAEELRMAGTFLIE